MEKRGRKKNCEDGVDKISNLPDPLLHMILSGLPTTEEVIRTSILCKRWRYLWTSVSFIDVDYSRGQKPIYQFEDFVDRVLANHCFKLDSFRISCCNYCELSTIERWIFSALKKDVASLDLMFCPDDLSDDSEDIDFSEESEDTKSPVIYDSLKVLRLFLYGRPLRLPCFTEFQGVRVLELNSVDLFYKDTDNKICRLNNLEDLSLIDCLIFCECECTCSNLKSLRIISRKTVHGTKDRNNVEVTYLDDYMAPLEMYCPKLEFFEFRGNGRLTIGLNDQDSLKEAIIQYEDVGFEYVCTMLAENLHVESLSVGLYYILKFIETEDDPLSLPNLKTLKLTTTYDFLPIDVLTQFLISLPVLESLHFIIEKSDGCNGGSGYWKLEEEETTKILTCHLKTVKFVGFRGEKLKMDIARALLEHGNSLEEMVFVWDNKAKYHKKSTEIMKNLSKFHTASSTVKLNAFLE